MTNAEIKAWCKSHGMWDRYVEIRDDLQRSGVEPKLARQQAFVQVQHEYEECRVSDVEQAVNEALAETLNRSGVDFDGGGEVIPAGIAPWIEPAEPEFGPDDVDGKCSYMTTLEWVAENIHTAKPDWDLCPSKVAVSLWRTYRSNPGAFFERVMPKPTKGEQEQQDRFQDDGRKDLQFIDRIERAMREAVAAATAESN